MKAALQGIGMSEEVASLLVELQIAINENRVMDEVQRTSESTTPTQLEEFLKSALTPGVIPHHSCRRSHPGRRGPSVGVPLRPPAAGRGRLRGGLPDLEWAIDRGRALIALCAGATTSPWPSGSLGSGTSSCRVIDAWTEIPMEQPVAFVRALGHFLDELH
ncbi:MAG TPA: hypothetical protein VEM93_04425 [Actinomycetota bacterium]|nr:hypothetical protein [Actinomycetota bacterium]